MQNYTMTQSYFQKKGRVASIHTFVKSSALLDSFGVHHLEEEDAARVCDWYSYEMNQSSLNQNVDKLPLNGRDRHFL